MTKGVTFYLVRHGETYFNRAKRIQGWADSQLTPEGIETLKQSGRGLAQIHFDAAYSSDLRRARESAQVILQENDHWSGQQVEAMASLREVRFGYFEGMLVQEVRPLALKRLEEDKQLVYQDSHHFHQLLDAYHAIDPTGTAESYKDFWIRVEAGILALLDRHKGSGDQVLVVSHGQTIRHILYALVPEVFQTQGLMNASVSVITYHKGQFYLEKYGDTSHFKD